MEIFDLVLGQVQQGCFLVVVASALTSISSMSKHRTLRTVWDQSSSDSRRTSAYVKLRFSTTNSDFQLRFSKTNFHFETPIFENKLPFSKTYSHFQTPIFESKLLLFKLPFFKANFDFPIQFFENKLRFSTKQTPVSQVRLKCPFKLPYIYPSRRNKRIYTWPFQPTNTGKQSCLPRSFIKGSHYLPDRCNNGITILPGSLLVSIRMRHG